MHMTVFEYERGLKYVEGRFQKVLLPGRYWVGLWGKNYIRKVDIRPQYITVPGQSILTKDGVGLKISLSAVYEIADPIAAINQVSDYYQALYLTLQNGLRTVVAETSIDDLMANRTGLNQLMLEASAEQVASIGLRLVSVSIKDIMLPGELKKLYAQVIQARQESLAQLERTRGETASLRSLANAARLTNDNPSLLQLRLIQALEQSNNIQLALDMPNERN